MWRETQIGPLHLPGPKQRQRMTPVMHLRRQWLLCCAGRSRGAPGAFTLVELLTVVSIIAILATLLMTTLSSVKRKAREAVCISNLHQIGIALHLYLEDFGKRPAGLETLASAKYLGDGRILTCPADRSSASAIPTAVSDVKSLAPSQPASSPPPVHVSYQHPLAWSDQEWNRLMEAQTRAGVVVCMFHDVASTKRGAPVVSAAPEGLILRGQLDGVVVRRHFYPAATSADGSPPALSDRTAAGASSSFAAAAPVSTDLPPWELFSDETTP